MRTRNVRTLLALAALLTLAACEVVEMPPPGATPSVPTQAAVPPYGLTDEPSPTQVGLAPSQPPAAPAQQPATPAAPLPTQTSPQPGAPAQQLADPALDEARDLLADGDYEGAAEQLAALLIAEPGAQTARERRLALAESFALRGRWGSAAEVVRPILDEGRQDETFARALFLLARSYEEAGAHTEAAAAFARYEALGTPIAPYAQLRRAAQDQARGALAEAAAAYEAAAASPIVNGERAGALMKAADVQRALGRPDEALRLYRTLLDAPAEDGRPALADPPAFRAQVLAAAAAAAREAGDVELARAWLRDAAALAPASGAALDAATQLLADPQGGLDPSTASAVLTAHERPADALPYLDAAIAAAQGEQQIDLRRRRGLALRDLGDFAGALQELASAGAALPNSTPGRQAQLDWVQTLGQSGDVPRAIQGYREFAAAYPEDERAPEALSRAATLLERSGDADGAAQQRLDLGRRYPAAAQTPLALALAGRHLFAAGRPTESRAAWEALAASAEPTIAAQGAYWSGRAAQQAGAPEARGWFERAAAVAPDSYYAARASEQLGLAQPTGSIPVGERLAAEDWSAIEFLGCIVGARAAGRILTDPTIVRALALAEVGLAREAAAEWSLVLQAWREDPARLAALARLAHERHQPSVALRAADRLARRSPAGNAASTPLALRRLIYPTPYSALVLEQSAEFGVDPLALYALMRQESLFEASATSWVGARGLAQVMPSTGEGIAQSLGVQGFRLDDLYQPAVSVRFGAFYLSRQVGNMGGSLPGALAAYNGGLGNAQRWAGGGSVADQDLFIEGIDFRETREYVRLVYGYRAVYQGIYQAEELP